MSLLPGPLVDRLLNLAPCFYPARSPQFIFYTDHNNCPSLGNKSMTSRMPTEKVGIPETTCFYYQNYDNYFVYEHDFESPWLKRNKLRGILLPKQ